MVHFTFHPKYSDKYGVGGSNTYHIFTFLTTIYTERYLIGTLLELHFLGLLISINNQWLKPVLDAHVEINLNVFWNRSAIYSLLFMICQWLNRDKALYWSSGRKNLIQIQSSLAFRYHEKRYGTTIMTLVWKH